MKQSYAYELRQHKKLKHAHIDSSISGKGYYIISGSADNLLFFKKVIRTSEGYAYAEINCPPAHRDFYNKVVQVCKTLRAAE